MTSARERTSKAVSEYLANGGAVKVLPPVGSDELAKAMDAKRKRAGRTRRSSNEDDEDEAPPPRARAGDVWRALERMGVKRHRQAKAHEAYQDRQDAHDGNQP